MKLITNLRIIYLNYIQLFVIVGYIPDIEEDCRKKKVSWHTLRGKRSLFKHKVMFEKFQPKVLQKLKESLIQ